VSRSGYDGLVPSKPKRRQRGTGSIEELPSGRFRGRWKALDGRTLSYTADTRREVQEHMEEARTDQRRRGYDLAPRSVTVNVLCDAWWKSKQRSIKPRAAERYEDHLAHIRRLLGSTPIADLTYERVEQFIADLEDTPVRGGRTMAPKTIRGCYSVLALVLQHAQRRGKMRAAIPKPDLPAVRRPVLTIPTRQEVDDLAAASDARLWAPVLLAGYCGLREGELLALHRRDVHLAAEKIGDEVVPPRVFVHRARNKTSGALESTKTDRPRNVYLPSIVVDALALHLAEYEAEMVVPVTASVLQKSWQRARASCGLDQVRFHDLRHAAASIMIAAGLNVKEVSEQLGHSNATQTLDVYSHLFRHSWSGAIQRLDAYLSA